MRSDREIAHAIALRIYGTSHGTGQLDTLEELVMDALSEVRKPLVGALEKLRDGGFETTAGNAYTGCSPETEIVIVSICNRALAKVKESK